MNEIGKRVKKLIGQNKFTMTEIARICNCSIEECTNAYESYTGKKILASFLLAGNKRQKNELRKLILNNSKVLLFGNHGVGKSSLPKIIADKIGWRVINSYPRNNEDLLKDFAQLPLQTKNTIFVIEGDLFYWRSYALINHYIQESKNPIIIIVNDKKTVHGTIEKNLVKMKLNSPTKTDVEEFIRKKYPDWDGNINDIYDSDMRITLRNLKYGFKSRSQTQEEKLDSQQVTYKILTGKCCRKDIENCGHPISFILNWLGNNVHKFYEDENVFDDISFVDAHKYNYKKKYLDGMLLNIPKQQKRAKMSFPPIKFKPKKEKKKTWTHKKIKKSTPKKQEKILKFTGDMIL